MARPRAVPDQPPPPSRDALLIAALGEAGVALEAAGSALQAIAATLRPAPPAPVDTARGEDAPPFVLGSTPAA